MKNNSIYLALFLSAAAVLIYEIAASEILIFFFTASTYSVATVLSSFLTGLALGSFLVMGLEKKIGNKTELFILLQILSAIYAITILPRYDYVYSIYLTFMHSPEYALWWNTLKKLCVGMIYFVIPTTMLGASFPLAFALLNKKDDQSKKVAQLYTIDLLGAIIGSLIAGFWFLPEYGIKGTVLIGALLNFLSAFVLSTILKKKWMTFIVSIPCFILFLNNTFKDEFIIKDLKQGISKEIVGENILFDQNTAYGRISIFPKEHPILYISNTYECSEAYGKQNFESLSPFLLKQSSPIKALAIGMGCGYSAISILKNSTVKSLDIVEINPVLKSTLKFFGNQSLLTNPLITFHDQSVIDFLLIDKSTEYDFIDVDLYQPSLEYVAPFYTVEYFLLLKKKLKTPGGLGHIYVCCGDYEFAKSIYWTLKQVFSDVRVKAIVMNDNEFSKLEFFLAPSDFVSQNQEEDKLQHRLEKEKNYEISTLNHPIITNIWGKWLEKRIIYLRSKDNKRLF